MRDGEGEVCVGREGIGRGNVDGRTRSGTEGKQESCVYKPPSYFVWLEFCPPLALHGLSVRRFCSAKFRALVCSSTPHHFIFCALGNCMHQGHLWLEKAVVPLHHHFALGILLACACTLFIGGLQKSPCLGILLPCACTLFFGHGGLKKSPCPMRGGTDSAPLTSAHVAGV